MNEKPYLVLAYYHFTSIEDPEKEVKEHKRFFKDRDVKGRIYISEEGINGQMSGYKDDALAYMEWMKSRDLFTGIEFKVQEDTENIFAKMTVKTRKELVAMGRKVDLNKRGEHLSPDKWKEVLSNDEDYVLLDVRNDYEWEVGHFKGAIKPNTDTFRDFLKQAEELKTQINPKKTKILMYCTGGIRCEYYSAYLNEEGFSNIYQLEGGVINYGLKEGSELWDGKLFVFDDRLTIPIKEGEEATPISTCHHCGEIADKYYNCANMDCNELFLCCDSCLHQFKGCCCSDCISAPRVRPVEHVNGKPFRKWYTYMKQKQPGTNP